MDLLHEAGDRVDADGQPAIELCHDLMEQSGRAAEDDGFSGFAVVDAALDMMQAGIDAREQTKASSRAAERRNERMMRGTATPVVSNDPIDW
jgi:hypothetical protein